MGDKRDSQRQHVLKAGTILFDGSGTGCLVRKIWLGGANLEVESQTGIPDSFDLPLVAEVIDECLRQDPGSFLQNGSNWVPPPWIEPDGKPIAISRLYDLACVVGLATPGPEQLHGGGD